MRFSDPAGLLQDMSSAGLVEGQAEGIQLDYFMPVCTATV